MFVKLALGSRWRSSGSTSWEPPARTASVSRWLSANTAGSFRQRSRCQGLLRRSLCFSARGAARSSPGLQGGLEHGARIPTGSGTPLAIPCAAAGRWRVSQTKLYLFSKFAPIPSGWRFASRCVCGVLGPGPRALRQCLCPPLPEMCSDFLGFFFVARRFSLAAGGSVSCSPVLEAHMPVGRGHGLGLGLRGGGGC